MSLYLGSTEIAGSISTLSGLTDVTITSAINGQVLVYDGNGWINGVDNSAIDCGTLPE